MLKITKVIDPFETCCDFLQYEPDQSLFFDIETTGLSAASSCVFLIGSIFFDGENWVLVQFLAESPSDEPDLLDSFFQLADARKTLIHFNGSSFDIPFLRERARHYQITSPFETSASLDLYQKFRPLKKILQLKRMNQTALESFLSWNRTDRLTGKHMIALFKKYTLSHEPLIADLLLLHNHDDLLGMTQILKLSSYLMLFQGNLCSAAFQEDTDDGIFKIQFQLNYPLPLPVHLSDSIIPSKPSRFERSTDNLSLQMRSASIKEKVDCPSQSGIQEPCLTSCKTDNPEFCITLDAEDALGALTIPVFHGELKYFFPDYKNYYYIPLEDQAIHKTIGAFVDREYRQNARPENCYVKKTSFFLPQPEPLFEPVFRFSYTDHLTFFEYKNVLSGNTKQLMHYTRHVLEMLAQSR